MKYTDGVRTCVHLERHKISMCPDCGISLKLTNALNNAGMKTWSDVKESYATGDIFDIKGVGEKSVLKLMDMEFRKD